MKSSALALLLCDELSDFRDQIARNVHYSLGGLNSGFVLQKGFLFGLMLVVSKYPSRFLLVPPRVHCLRKP
jgi:hypothetical protein